MAGAGSGVLTTTQQSALALGVATLGSLFLALAADGDGHQHGFHRGARGPGRDRGGRRGRRPRAAGLAPVPPGTSDRIAGIRPGTSTPSATPGGVLAVVVRMLAATC